jgi:hypothetical protein
VGGTYYQEEGVILRTTNGGTTWTRLTPTTKVSLAGVSGRGGTFWAVDDGGSVLRLAPAPTVGTPDAPETMRDDTYYTVKGTLKPRHTEGTKPIRIYKYKKVDGVWVSKGYSTATAYDYSTYSQYKKKMSFSSPGKWRLRAYHPTCSLHRKRWSTNYEYVTVTR